MKRGKEEEKIMGPMFPRLHVNDTEKGGPKAPPRNKMALYEQLSIPSQRFSPGMLPLNPNITTSLFSTASSSQVSGNERGMLFPCQLPPSVYKAEDPYTRYSNSNTPLVQLEKKKLDEDDFRVPIFVQSGVGQEHSRCGNNMDRENLSPLSPAYPSRPMTVQGGSNKEPNQSSYIGLNLTQKGTSQSEENSKEYVAGREHSVKFSPNLSSREKTKGLLKQVNASSSYEHKDHPESNFNRLEKTDDSLRLDYRAGSQPDNVHDNNISNEPTRGIANGDPSIQPRDFQSEEQTNLDVPFNDTESLEDDIFRSLEMTNEERGDDVSETSMVDSISDLDISPDDVVGIIGQKHFWKARRAIINQQRVFAVQVFELHRLIKVQRLIAESPHLLLEDDAYLGKSYPAKKLPLEYIVKIPPNAKHKDDFKKQTHKMEFSAENAVGKTSLSSVQNFGTNPGPFLGNPLPMAVATDDTKVGPWYFHRPPGQQWLVPVMSPSEGLVYKPYPGPGFVSGGCGPPGSTPMMVPAYHHYQGVVGVSPFAPPAGHGYFPSYGMPIMNPGISDSAVEQMNHFARQEDLHGRLSGGGANFKIQHRSSSGIIVSSQKDEAVSNVVKLHASKVNELQVSTASSPSERARRIGVGHSTDGRNVLPLFPTSPSVNGVPQLQETEKPQPAQVIKVVPHNARSATKFAARIFQSIQEERKQYDFV